jgi:hypothetical protein
MVVTGSAWMGKGSFLARAFDAAYSDPVTRQANYDAALELLRSGAPLSGMTRDWSSPQQAHFDDDARNHFQEHWLDASPASTALETYMREAFTETIEHAQARDVGLEAIWIFGGDDSPIEIAYVDNPNSVLVVIKTPMRKVTDDPLRADWEERLFPLPPELRPL